MIEQKTLSISLMGPPNAGKSTLINLIVGEKVSGASPKAHTTRVKVHGIKVIDNTQLVFLDTPGFAHNNSELDIETDCVCLVLDATHPWQYNMQSKIKKLAAEDILLVIVINKADLIPKTKWIELIHMLQDLGYKGTPWLISALYNKGVDNFLQFLINSAPECPWWFDGKQKHILKVDEIILECIREKIFHITHKEVPYNIELNMQSFKKNKHVWEAKVQLKTQRMGQKKILIGKNGSVVKSIGEAARMELITRFGPGCLFLNVC